MSGVHYPVGKDGHADTSRGGLRITEDDGWRFAEDDEPLHNETHHERHLELELGGEG